MPKRKFETEEQEQQQMPNKRFKPLIKQYRVSATKTRNYLMNDPMLDWLNLYGNDAGLTKQTDEHLKILFRDGIQFEDDIIAEMRVKFKGYFEEIRGGSFSQRIIKTKISMSEGVPIIYQGVVENRANNSFGIPDLIVRVDFLNTLMNQEVVSPTALEADPVYANSYCIVDIKHSTLRLSAVDHTIYNSIRVQPYKGQVIIYSEAISEVQGGYLPPYAYILGRRTVISGESYGPFEYLGVIDIKGKDAHLIEKSRQAVKWYQDLKEDGANWDVWVPHRWEMMPNMSNYDKAWQAVKYQLAYHQGELTLLWKVGFKERNQFWRKGIKSWRNRRFNVESLKAAQKNEEYLKVAKQSLEVNRTDYKDYLPLMIQQSSTTSFQNWREKDTHLELYIDFETASNHIFMIGMGYENRSSGKWIFEHFIANSLNPKDEGDVVRRWLARVKLLRNRRPTRLIHWSTAERTNFKNALNRHNIRDVGSIEWVDLYKFFLEIPISVRGSFTYGLKDIATSLHATGNISTTWEDDGMNGLTAMILAKDAESNRVDNLEDVPLMGKIVRYNEIDCKVLWEILSFVRGLI